MHCAVVVLTELYGVTCLTPGDSVRLAPGESAWVLDEESEPSVGSTVPDGWERTTDLYKLLASTEPFDAAALAQVELVAAHAFPRSAAGRDREGRQPPAPDAGRRPGLGDPGGAAHDGPARGRGSGSRSRVPRPPTSAAASRCCPTGACPRRRPG